MTGIERGAYDRRREREAYDRRRERGLMTGVERGGL